LRIFGYELTFIGHNLTQMAYTQFPAPSTSYESQPAAWVRIRGASFNTIPGVRAAFLGRNFSADNNYILPLQRYDAPNAANYQDTEPGGGEQLMQGIRDLFTGDVSKLAGSVMSGLGLNSVMDVIGGVGGAALQDMSFSDLTFKFAHKRTHNFGWTLIAKNRQDSDNLDKIANNLQSRLYPFLIDTLTSKVKPPEMWKIEILPNGGGPFFKSGPSVLDNQIQLCVLSNFKVSRFDNSSGPVLTSNNKFLGLELTATFTEIEPAYRTWNITNVRGEAKHNTIMSRSKATAGSALPIAGAVISQIGTEALDILDDNVSQPVVDTLGLSQFI
jgi:hypothetical protein